MPSEKVGVIGSGYIGSVIASVLAEAGYDVVAVDINERLIAAFRAGEAAIAEPGLAELVAAGQASGKLRFTTDFAEIADRDVLLVTVGTPLSEDFDADLSHLEATAAYLRPYLRDGQLICVKSTVPPGTTRQVFVDGLAGVADLQVAFSPERLAEGAAIRELKALPIVVGGIDAATTARASAFWRAALGVETIELGSPEAAEMVKLADNLWIDLNIALAHDLAKLCDAMPWDLDVLEVIKAANSLKKGQHYVNILTPSNGVGGYCLTKDPWFVDALGKRHGVELLTPRASRTVNDSMPAYCARAVLDHLAAKGTAPADARVAVMGLAFKTNSGDIRLTPVLPFLAALREAGVRDIAIHDPMVIAHEAAHAGEALVEDADAALSGADAAVFMVGHDALRAIDPARLAGQLKPGALVLDGRLYVDAAGISAIREHNLEYRGIGR